MSGIQQRVVGRPPTHAEGEIYDWGQEVFRRSTAVVQESLKLLVTLDTALLGGAAALLSRPELKIPLLCKIVCSFFLVLSLSSALWGHMPREVSLDLTSLNELAAERRRGSSARMFWLRLASLSLVIALAALLGGVLLG